MLSGWNHSVQQWSATFFATIQSFPHSLLFILQATIHFSDYSDLQSTLLQILLSLVLKSHILLLQKNTEATTYLNSLFNFIPRPDILTILSVPLSTSLMTYVFILMTSIGWEKQWLTWENGPMEEKWLPMTDAW